MSFKEIENKQVWNEFVFTHGPDSGFFLQSWQWGEFQKSVGNEVFRIGFFEGETMMMAAQMIKMSLPFGKKYFFCPRGPIMKKDKFDYKFLNSSIKEFSKFHNAMFVRFDVPQEGAKISGVKKVKDVQPANTLVLDISQDSEKLLALMHHKTRYNIRLSEKKGVVVETNANHNFDDVWELFIETAKRGVFKLHSKEYYKAMLEALSGGECKAYLSTASFENEIIAANIMIDCNGVRTYLHGASSNKHRNVMGPFLLHWKLIEEAKKSDLNLYDWWGVAPIDADDDHPWKGITRFKTGFGGDRIDYPGTYDMVSKSAWYSGYMLSKKIVKIIR